MTVDPIWIWIALAVVAALVVIGLIARGARRSRTEALREKYGTEYEHAVESAGSRKRAENDLIERVEEAKMFQIRQLTAAEHARFRDDWNRIEMRFLERPTTTVVEADELVAEIMRTRGYPMGDFEKHASHLSVDHPRVVEHYRSGHAAIDANRDGKSSTEELRQSMLHYRALMDELLGSPRSDTPREIPVEREEDRV
ncbi:MAG TPA: hypothetical protein VM779_14295 [Thermoanaerobaculia bacterium]|nr:hypothetical protein [Thermoanaerobaculia bacterium]